MDWFLYDNGLRLERVNEAEFRSTISPTYLDYYFLISIARGELHRLVTSLRRKLSVDQSELKK